MRSQVCAGVASQAQRSRPGSARSGCRPVASSSTSVRDLRSLSRPHSAGSAYAYAYARAGCAAVGQIFSSPGCATVLDATDAMLWACFSLSLPLDLPEELFSRSCGSLLAYELRVLLETCRLLRAQIEKFVAQLLSEVHALDWRRHAPHALSLLRQLHISEQMVALVKPTMSVFRKPIILAIRASSSVRCGRQTAGWPETVWSVPHDFRVPKVAITAVSVACGRRHVLLLDRSGNAWAVGDARAGGIPVEGKDELLRPERVAALSRVRLLKVACGNGHTVAMSMTGDVFTWGRVLGEMGVTDDASDWQLPDASRGLAGEAVDVAAGDAHAAAASLTGDTYVWGQNHHGQCARDPSLTSVGDSRSPNSATCLLRPARAGGALDSAVARRVACGKYHTVVLSADGVAYSFGASLSGQLGRTSSWSTDPPWQPARVLFHEVACESRSSQSRPCRENSAGERRRIEANTTNACSVRIVQVVCGDEHTLCLTDAGRAYAFGSGSHGQLGLGTVRCHRSPVLVRLGKIRELAAGLNWSLFRERSGKVFQAGRDEEDVDDCRLLRQIAE